MKSIREMIQELRRRKFVEPLEEDPEEEEEVLIDTPTIPPVNPFKPTKWAELRSLYDDAPLRIPPVEPEEEEEKPKIEPPEENKWVELRAVESSNYPEVRMGKKNWIKGAIKKKGALRQQLGVKKGEKIPASKLAKAAKSKGKLGQRARLAQTLAKMGRPKKKFSRPT